MSRLRWHLVFAALAGVALRLFFVLYFSTDAGDTPVYEDLATNWLKHGTYALLLDGRLIPADARVPGYPAFLVMIYALTGRVGAAARLWVMLVQVIVDLGTCLLTAALAAVLAPKEVRRRAALIALWFAATCPFLANYCGVPLTEVLATFFTTAALLCFAKSVCAVPSGALQAGSLHGKTDFLGAILAGLATLIRPESALVLATFLLVLAWQERRPSQWKSLMVRGAALGCLAVIPLLPWAARNAITLYKVQFLASRYAELPGQDVPAGFIAWEKTWLFRLRDVYLVSWKLETAPIAMEDIPPYAFDSPEERERVAALLAKHNTSLELTEDLDGGFEQLARERTSRRPLRTYLWVPCARMFTMWFTPRTEVMPISGHLWPLRASWEDDPVDFSVTVGLIVLNIVYVGLAITGAWRLWRAPPAINPGAKMALALIILFVLVRTAFLTTIETPEPRYVIECFPAVLALAAQTWTRQRSSSGSG